MFRKILTEEKLEITLVSFKRYSKEDIKRGMVICKFRLSHTLHLKLRFISEKRRRWSSYTVP
jgi:hypothetical protein